MKLLNLILLTILLTTSVSALNFYTEGDLIARDNPFAEYEGELPSLHVETETNQEITLTVTHKDNLLLGTGFPWYEGAKVLEVKNTGTRLDINKILFPLRGDYIVNIKAGDEEEQYILHLKEPFKQSTLNAIIFLAALLIFGIIVGLVFGKKADKKGKAGIFIALLLITAGSVFAHESDAHNYYQDDDITFYTTPENPDIGEDTIFTFYLKDQSVNNVHITLSNEEEGFDVLDLNLHSETGVFSFHYSIFDGAPHVAKIVADGSLIEVPFSGTAHSPPLREKVKAGFIMLLTMVIGFIAGIFIKRWF